MQHCVALRCVLLLLLASTALTRPAVAQDANAYTARDVADGGVISGHVTLTGTASAPTLIEITKDLEACGQEPQYTEDLIVDQNGSIQDVVVWLTDVREGKPWPSEIQSATLDQKGCRFAPHVLVVQAGQQFDVLNNDGVLHNVHTRGTENRPVNKAHPKFLPRLRIKLNHPEIVHVKCDAHEWMSGWIAVAAHPYYAVTDANGSYSLEGVPAGTYTLQFWHEQLGTQTQQVTVAANGRAQVDAAYVSN